ncbi:MAG: hypothetical protein ACK528_06510, partial [Alphaproteobacteria bacterium]
MAIVRAALIRAADTRPSQGFPWFQRCANDNIFPGKKHTTSARAKKSVTRFVSRHQAELVKSRKGELEINAGIDLLKALLESEVRRESEGARILSHEIDRLERRVNQESDGVVAEVWQ